MLRIIIKCIVFEKKIEIIIIEPWERYRMSEWEKKKWKKKLYKLRDRTWTLINIKILFYFSIYNL